MNDQAIEKRFHSPEGLIQVHSIFPTIQGEGPFAGMPAVFVRLAGCNLQCPACDTDYTSNRENLIPDEILRRVQDALSNKRSVRCRSLVVITGGEPFRQGISKLADCLTYAGLRVQIETNGLYHDPSFNYDRVTVVCSPKTGAVNGHLVRHLAALKYVLDADNIDPNDGLPLTTLGRSERVYRPGGAFQGEIYVQPLDTGDLARNHANTKAAIASAMRYGYRLCIQTHKLLDLP